MLCLSGNSPCLNGGACTDGIGQYTCACAAGFCGPTCADPAQPNGQCPCADDPAWTDVMVTGGPCSSFATDRDYYWYYCSRGADAAGVTAAVACPVSCQSGCALTYDDCCELPPSPPISFMFLSVFYVHFRRLDYTCAVYVKSGSNRSCDFTAVVLVDNRPCLNGGVCTDGIGSFTCDCAGTGYYGRTCEISQTTPCVDDPAWVDPVTGGPCSSLTADREYYCSRGADAAGVTASEACPILCESGCALTYDDCCELPAHLLSPCCLILYISLILLLVLSVLLRRVSKFSLISPSFSLTSLSFLSHVSPSIGTSHTSLVSLLHHSHFFHFSHNIV
jgi:hypothetical protein